MTFQATVASFGLLTSSAATAAVLCTLVVTWWALVLCALSAGLQVVGTVRASGTAKELKQDPSVDDAPAPITGEQRRAEAWPTDLDLGIDFETFRAQIRHDFEAFQAQVGRRLDLAFQDPGSDFEAFQAQIGRRCDLELDALCETAMDDQSAKVLQDLQDEFVGGPRCQPTNAEPRMDFEAFWANAELHRDGVLEGMRSQGVDAIDGALDRIYAAALSALEDACGGSSALDDDAQADYALEMEEELSRQAAELLVMEAGSMHADITFDVAADEYE